MVNEEINNENNRTPMVVELEKNLLRTSWVKEAQLIRDFVPEEDLTQAQIKLLDKCINKEDFTDKQFADLKLVLNKYRALLNKLNPQETVESVEEVVQLIQTEKDFINLMENDVDKYLTVHLPTRKGLLEFEFEVLPLTDSRVVEALELEIDLFNDFTLEETAMYSSASGKSPEERTPEEESILKRMNEIINEKISRKKIESIDNFLANQLILKDSDASLDERRKFWSVFLFNAKVSVFVVVQKRLGLTEVDNKRLFPFGE